MRQLPCAFCLQFSKDSLASSRKPGGIPCGRPCSSANAHAFRELVEGGRWVRCDMGKAEGNFCVGSKASPINFNSELCVKPRSESEGSEGTGFARTLGNREDPGVPDQVSEQWILE